MKYETSIFKIENVEKLSANYLLFEIVGLASNDDNYESNIQFIVKKLSYELRHPITYLNKGNKVFLVVKEDERVVSLVPDQFLVKHEEIVYFKRTEGSLKLDFSNYTDETKGIILRFLQFDIQSELSKLETLWQPGAGDAFFNRDPKTVGAVSIYNGFYLRAVEIPGGGFGVALDVTKKYIASQPLPTHLTRTDFRRMGLQNSHLMYQYGKKRYEIRPVEFSDLNASQCQFKRPSDGKLVNLLEDTQEVFKGFMSPLIANLPDDASVLIYRNNSDQERKVIAGLCYQVFDTEDPIVRKLHKESILKPFYRRRYIRAVHHRYLKKLMFGNTQLAIGSNPVLIKKEWFQVPDLLFGKEVSLSVRGSQGSTLTTTEKMGKMRKELLIDKHSGFYSVAPFQSQYVVLPQTVFNMYANEKYFINDLIEHVNKMHITEAGWKPKIITYDNREKKTAIQLGFEIMQKITETVENKRDGYALIMLPSNIRRIKRQHDELAALVVSECLQKHNLTASIIHSEMLEHCYSHRTENGQTSYYIQDGNSGKYRGYLAGVAINQVLLNNERWPYILKTPLHADITIGIDVKKRIAGFTFIDKFSKNILTRTDKSNNKERLSTGQVVKMLVNNITLLAKHTEAPINTVVIHRDGRLFKEEKDGIMRAVELLKEKQVISSTCTINIVEIPKHSIYPFRLFEVLKEYDLIAIKQDNNGVLNPQVGSYTIINSGEAFICTTGREFKRDGTSNPLYVKYNEGSMSFKEILEDIYYLSCLAYTKPDDCSRYPLTIKITDRRINTLGSEYDEEELEILKAEHI